MRTFTVAVDYLDLLQLTLPDMMRTADEVVVVTDPRNRDGVLGLPCRGFSLYVTDLFYADGAQFAKWRALEAALDDLGREGWLCFRDADVLWPAGVEVEETSAGLTVGGCAVVVGQLFCPLRAMAPWPYPGDPRDEGGWAKWPTHRNVREWAGYSQVFHGSDRALGPPPWHEVDWRHAGGADSFFQAKWPEAKKLRPPWRCLHLGEAGVNWAGRCTAYGDGSLPEGAEARRASIMDMWRGRRLRERTCRGAEVFAPERTARGTPTPPERT